jgi:hypothetical protein
MSCRHASKEEASDMLSAENHRVDSLRKQCFSIEDLEAKYGSQWPIVAHAFVSVSIPIKIGYKKAVSSVTELQNYCISSPHLGSFVGGADGKLNFQWFKDQINEPEYLAVPANVADDEPPSQEAIVPHQVSKTPVISNPETNAHEQVNLPPSFYGLHGASPNVQVICEEDNVDVDDDFSIKTIRKRNRVISSSASETSPPPQKVNKKLPVVMKTATTRSKSQRSKVQTVGYKESEEDGFYNVDDDINDPTYSPPKETGLKARRKALLTTQKFFDSDSSSESESEQETESNSDRKAELKQGMKEVGLSLDKSDMERAMQSNRFLLEYKSWIALNSFSEKHEESLIRNIAKTMNFFAEGNKIDNFSPMDLLDSKKRDDFYDTLSVLGIKTKTISSYCSALEKMYACESVKVGHPFHIKISFVDLEKTCKLKKTGLQKRMKHDKQNRLAVLENKPVDSSQVLKNLIHAMKHLKEKSNKIINAIPEGYLPTASDNRLVNTYFYVHFICNSGSRPSAFARMRLKEIKNAKKRPQLTNDKGDSYRYLSTTDHKTGDSYIARVNFYEEDWQILYKYYKYMRPKAYDDKNDKYLFLNSNGKLLTSPPADLIDILKQEGIPHFTATDARHALTTLP